MFRIERLLLVDGSNLLFQMFYGMPARIVNAQGKAIQGTLGFTGALLKIIRMTQPTHVAVLFDGEHENERTAIDADYKANRPDYRLMADEDTPFSQLPDIRSVLDFIKIPHAETTICETDDWMAGYAFRYGNDMDVIISSFDSDFFQLITDRVSVLRYRGKQTVICTPAYLREHFDITPSQYAALKSLTGDAADHIKGAEKIGPKTAAALLKQYGTLDCIITNAPQISKPSVRASILKHAERLRVNYQLIKLNGSAPLPFMLDELVYHPTSMTTTEILTALHIK